MPILCNSNKITDLFQTAQNFASGKGWIKIHAKSNNEEVKKIFTQEYCVQIYANKPWKHQGEG